MKKSFLHYALCFLLFGFPAIFILKNSYPLLPAPLVFEVALNNEPIGQKGPLIVSGNYKAADFLFVEWVQPDQVVFRYSSWGFPEELCSSAVQIPQGKKLHLVVQMPSVAPGSPQLKVRCDGITLLEGSPHFYPASPSDLSFGKNLFGQAFCGRDLPGKLFQENGRAFKGSPDSFFSPSQRLLAWVKDGWKLFIPAAIAFAFLRAGRPLTQSIESLGPHPLDKAIARLSKFAFRIQPHAFVVGILVSLVTLSYAGRQVSQLGYIQNFERFYPTLNQEAYFFPTSSLLKSIAESAIPSGQTLVIIGGSSISHGVGQPSGKIWTQTLQGLLGQQYRVLNFAMRSGNPSENGAIAAEMLRKEGARVIYVADVSPAELGGPDAKENYRYIFWDAYYKGLLLENPRRDAYFKSRTLDAKNRESLQEARLAAWFNSFCYSLDFWNYQAYTNVSTVYTNYVRPFYAPRWQAPDTQKLQPDTHYFYGSEAEMGLVRNTLWNFFPETGKDAAETQSRTWGGFDNSSNSFFPTDIRSDTILVTVGHSPFYKNQLTPAEQEKLRQVYTLCQTFYEKAGYASVNATEILQVDDFVDRSHLSISGGDKLASLVAQKIREMDSKISGDKKRSL